MSQPERSQTAQSPSAEAMPTAYEPAGSERSVYQRWLDAGAFRAIPDERGADESYVVMMPLPNVTGALHMGHAMDNVMQDLLVRWHRMRGDNTLWMAGTDHAGIATQAVVEKRLLELEGKTRLDLGREALVERIWDWKDQYQARIVAQQQAMGCSCDWERQRFTMDAVCSRAVRWTFFAMFRDGLIYRGNRLVNWDCVLKTAVADDEIEHKRVEGRFWHLRYPVIDPAPGEPEFVTVATTRPETMLGDTAVACHPDPAGQLELRIEETRLRLASASAREKAEIAAQLAEMEARRQSHLPALLQLVAMAAAGRMVRLPLVDRAIPIIIDPWAKPELGSGVVKITPGHDPNDYEVWQRQNGAIHIINILEEDGRLNAQAGPYAGIDRFEARDRIAADLDALGLVAFSEAREIELGHSDRSKTPIEPFLSRQWFVSMGDRPEGVLMGRGTRYEHRVAGLAQSAIEAAGEGWKSASGRGLDFHPDRERYRSTYLNWLAEKRDWCISRQLWWGHRIPIWRAPADGLHTGLPAALSALLAREDLAIRLGRADGESMAINEMAELAQLTAFAGGTAGEGAEILICPRDEAVDAELAAGLEQAGFLRDPDVLDTWFSSGLWPHSTLGWPDPETAPIGEGQLSLASGEAGKSALDAYYPGSCLVTGRDIITLWVARMVIMGLYNMGDLPFTDVFLHANILDGKGERMSKSKGNGIDPVDIIETYGTDAMRYVLAEMQTGTQDIRLPVQAVSPFTGKLIELAEAKHGRTIFTYLDPDTGEEFDVLGTMPELPSARLISDRFTVGRNFCNKLWNATRFALLNLEGTQFRPLPLSELAHEDRWILSRLSFAVESVDRELGRYNPAAAIAAAREFFWNELCDWYLELLKPRLAEGADAADAAVARQILAFALDQVLRLLHPFLPFITESLWTRLALAAPQRGLSSPVDVPELLIGATWPRAEADWRDLDLEERFAEIAEATRALRDIRNQYNLPPSARPEALARAEGAAAERLGELAHVLCEAAGLASLTIDAAAIRARDAATAVLPEFEIYLAGVVDLDAERIRLTRQLEELDRRIQGLDARLGNPSFVERAKPEVVEGARSQAAELREQREGVAANLVELG
jgi:valyl-tRNA synthetase